MKRKEKQGVHWIEYDSLQGCPVSHGTFLRHGGVSDSHLSTLNFGNVHGEKKENVEKNISIALDILEVPRVYSGQQRHGKEIVEITAAFLEKKEEKECDALMTNTPGIGLMIKHADCQAAILYDKVLHCLSVVHVGWRGSVHNLYKETIEKMNERYGTDPKNLAVGISPSLGPERAEFRNYLEELPTSFWSYQVKPLYFDFWQISQMQLQEAGVLAENIEIAGICTYECAEDCFSHRRNPVTGRHATIAALRQLP